MVIALGGLLLLAAFPALRPDFGRAPRLAPASGAGIAIDGDTFKLPVSAATPGCSQRHPDGMERVRVLPYDAPELEHARCGSERVLALRARDRLQQLLRVGRVELGRQGCDSYGRTRAVVMVDGRSAADLMMKEGLVKRFVPGQSRQATGPWCS
jgi:endonuclease YncB( thermonuclease family)